LYGNYVLVCLAVNSAKQLEPVFVIAVYISFCWHLGISSALFFLSRISCVSFSVKMPSEPHGSAAWESPSGTVVNTAAPSQAPSIRATDENLESAITTEKCLSRAQEVLGGIDPVTQIVGWDNDADPQNPMNFPRTKKWRMTMALAAITFCVSFSSSVFSTATAVTAEEFGVSLEVMILGVSLYVLGFACGMSTKAVFEYES
jgi:hypothetical protein